MDHWGKSTRSTHEADYGEVRRTPEVHVEHEALTVAPALPANRADRLFATRADRSVPGLADRYEYKKEAGSSDTQHSYDTLKV